MGGLTHGSTYFPKGGLARVSGGCRSLSGFQGQSPGRSGGHPPEAETNVKYLCNFFNVFLEKIQYLMNRTSNHVQTHIKKFELLIYCFDT